MLSYVYPKEQLRTTGLLVLLCVGVCSVPRSPMFQQQSISKVALFATFRPVCVVSPRVVYFKSVVHDASLCQKCGLVKDVLNQYTLVSYNENLMIENNTNEH